MVTYQEEILDELKVIIVKLTGDFGPELMNRLAITYRQKAYDIGYALICDTREGINNLTLSDGLKLLKKYEKPEYKHLKNVDTSMVCKGSQYIFFKVIEQFISNERADFKVFKELEVTLQWYENQL